jgi:hypothetical protein
MHAPVQHNPLLSDPILPTLLRLSLPNMGPMLATSLIAMARRPMSVSSVRRRSPASHSFFRSPCCNR